MSTNCTRCGTTFDSPFCPNCGSPAQQPINNQHMQQTPQQPYNNLNFQNPYGTYQTTKLPEKKKNGCLFVGLIALGSIVFIFIFSVIIISCLGAALNRTSEEIETSKTTVNESAGNQIITPTSTPTITTEDYLSEDEIQYIYSDPKKYRGKHVMISGIVFGAPETDGEGIYFQMFQDAVNNENNTVIGYQGDVSIKDGDYIIVDGIVKDVYEGENAFGGSVIAPAILADDIKISSYQDVVSPTEKTIDIKKSKEQYGYDISIEKVEISPIETRVYITVNNNGSSNFSAYSFNMKLVQGNKQYEEQSTFYLKARFRRRQSCRTILYCPPENEI